MSARAASSLLLLVVLLVLLYVLLEASQARGLQVTDRLEGLTTEWQIEATDRQIDPLVYELYGLTEEEIAIVEQATR